MRHDSGSSLPLPTLTEVILLCLILEFPEDLSFCFQDALNVSDIISDLAASTIFFFQQSLWSQTFHLSKARQALTNFCFEARELLSSRTDESSTPLKKSYATQCLRIVGLDISL